LVVSIPPAHSPRGWQFDLLCIDHLVKIHSLTLENISVVVACTLNLLVFSIPSNQALGINKSSAVSINHSKNSTWRRQQDFHCCNSHEEELALRERQELIPSAILRGMRVETMSKANVPSRLQSEHLKLFQASEVV
jgi:hypothetical protein